MLQSQLFTRTSKEAPKDAVTISHKLLTRGDFVAQLAAGIYSFLPLGLRVHKKIENIIREEMNALGAWEISMPALQPKALWEETGRWKNIDPPLFVVEDRHKREFALGPTHEEVITDIVRGRVQSYKDLPFSVYQIQTKFRNEMRATGGLLRTREFMMKDLYSFHTNVEDLTRYYKKIGAAYSKIFTRCGLKTTVVDAHSGSIGGSFSQEFMTHAESGEDTVIICRGCGYAANVEKTGNVKKCPKCSKANIEIKSCIESGHIFDLGTRYSKAMGATYTDKNGREQLIHMGCYGIGVGRLMATIVEANNDKDGIIWPGEVAPFRVHLIYLPSDKKTVKDQADNLYKTLQDREIEVLYDDREDLAAGEKFAETDLIGIPVRVVVSEKTTSKDSAEIKEREKPQTKLVRIKDVIKLLI